MATTNEWVAGARPRTLPAAVAPVLVGSAAAAHLDAFHLGHAALAAGIALALQVGVNYANDYSDGVRGTDVDRVGPMRLTASAAATPREVKTAAFAAFGVGALLGLTLVALTGQWWMLAVGVVAIVAGWTYTGGPKPYGYAGLGELGVFTFFGLVAVLGTTYTQAGRFSWPSLWGAISIGLLACALLMVNNLRDIPTDHLAGKRTLAVRIGDRKARRVFGLLVLVPFALVVPIAFSAPWALITLLLVPAAIALALTVVIGARGRLMGPVLAWTSMLELGYAVLLSLGLALS